MADAVNEALVEAVAISLARELYDENFDPFASPETYDNACIVARAIIPIVQVACEAEVVAWLREKAVAHGQHAEEAAIDLLKHRQVTAQAVALNWADAIERGEHHTLPRG